MSYKTITSFITGKRNLQATVRAGIALARHEDAHLDVICLGVDHTQTGAFYAGAPAMIYQETLDRAREEGAQIEAEVRAILEREDIRWGTERAVVQFGAIGGLVGLRARFSDLVVQCKPYGEDCTQEEEAVIEAALFEGQAPVLVLPESGAFETRPKRVIVAWNQSNEALSAVRRAMPLLRNADAVNIAIVDPPRHGPERSDPGGLLTQMLSRQDVRAEVSVLARTLPRVSDVLMRHMTDFDADLLVMGAYGHSRLREAILGGATRNMLEHLNRPVLLAH